MLALLVPKYEGFTIVGRESRKQVSFPHRSSLQKYVTLLLLVFNDQSKEKVSLSFMCISTVTDWDSICRVVTQTLGRDF